MTHTIGSGIDDLFNNLLNSEKTAESTKKAVRDSIALYKKSPEDLKMCCGIGNFKDPVFDKFGAHPPRATYFKKRYIQTVDGMASKEREYHILKSMQGHIFSVRASALSFRAWLGGPMYDVRDFKGYKYAVKREDGK